MPTLKNINQFASKLRSFWETQKQSPVAKEVDDFLDDFFRRKTVGFESGRKRYKKTR